MVAGKGLEMALKEAIAAGIKARDSETAELMEEARRKGWSQEDICGWSWIDIDLETFRNIIWLGLSGVRVTCSLRQPGFIAEDTQLYLDHVSDCQRFSASMAGMKAAAEVLQRHGIRAKENGMLD